MLSPTDLLFPSDPQETSIHTCCSVTCRSLLALRLMEDAVKYSAHPMDQRAMNLAIRKLETQDPFASYKADVVLVLIGWATSEDNASSESLHRYEELGQKWPFPRRPAMEWRRALKAGMGGAMSVGASREIAEEAAQEAIIRVVQRYDRLGDKPTAELMRLVWRSARHLIISRKRHDQTVANHSSSARAEFQEHGEQHPPDGDFSTYYGRALAMVRDIGRLENERHRQVLIASGLLELPAEIVMDWLKIPSQGALRTLRWKARKALRRSMLLNTPSNLEEALRSIEPTILELVDMAMYSLSPTPQPPKTTRRQTVQDLQLTRTIRDEETVMDSDDKTRRSENGESSVPPLPPHIELALEAKLLPPLWRELLGGRVEEEDEEEDEEERRWSCGRVGVILRAKDNGDVSECPFLPVTSPGIMAVFCAQQILALAGASFQSRRPYSATVLRIALFDASSPGVWDGREDLPAKPTLLRSQPELIAPMGSSLSLCPGILGIKVDQHGDYVGRFDVTSCATAERWDDMCTQYAGYTEGDEYLGSALAACWSVNGGDAGAWLYLPCMYGYRGEIGQLDLVFAMLFDAQGLRPNTVGGTGPIAESFFSRAIGDELHHDHGRSQDEVCATTTQGVDIELNTDRGDAGVYDPNVCEDEVSEDEVGPEEDGDGILCEEGVCDGYTEADEDTEGYTDVDDDSDGHRDADDECDGERPPPFGLACEAYQIDPVRFSRYSQGVSRLQEATMS